MKWIRPCGTELETDDRPVTIAFAEKHGWKKAKRKYTKKEPEPTPGDPVAEEETEVTEN